MVASRSLDQPRLVRNDVEADRVDPRVGAVLEVLGGESVSLVAARWAVDPALLHRWVRAFVDAGTAQVTNTPAGDVARQRDRFLAAFTHELRTPLAVAQGWLGILADGGVPAQTVESAIGHLQSALNRLAERTMDVELLTAAMLGRLRLTPREVTMGELSQGLPGLVEVDGAGGDLLVSADPELFGRILRDLWQAASMWPVPRAVRLGVEIVGPWVEVRIVRAGPPIEPRVLQSLFEPFDVNDDATGVTVGLYLARALTVVHGGTVGVEQDENGAVFWVRIPGVRHQADRETGHEGGQMKFKLACGDVMPGCAARFECTDRETLLAQVASHAADAHGITTITPDILAAVEGRIVYN